MRNTHAITRLSASLFLLLCSLVLHAQEDEVTAVVIEQSGSTGLLGGAQTDDAYLNTYLKARQLLEQSINVFDDSPLDARNSLSSAKLFFNDLQAGSVGDDSLIQGVDTTFERANTAIDNNSGDDLAVQASVIRGGLQRLLYEGAQRSLQAGNLAEAKPRLLQLAQDIGATEAQQSAMAASTDPNRLIANLEVIAAEAIQAQGEAAERNAANVGVAYLYLADAYSNYVLVQDSPRMPQGARALFPQAIDTLLQAGASDAFSQDINALSQQMTQFQADSSLFLESGVPGQSAAPVTIETNVTPVEITEDTTSEASATPVVVVTTDEGTTSPDEVIDDTGNGDTDDNNTEAAVTIPQVAVPTVAAPSSTSQGNSNGLAAPFVSVGQPDEAAIVPSTPAPAQTLQVQQPLPVPADSTVQGVSATATRYSPEEAQDLVLTRNRDAARREIARFNLPASSVDRLVNEYADNALPGVSAVLERLYSSVAKAAGATSAGDYLEAKTHIREYGSTYNTFLAPLVTEVAPDEDIQTRDLVKTLEQAPALRLQDNAILIEQTDLLASTLGINNRPVNASMHSIMVRTERAWVGWVRIIAMIAAALAAIVPLVLLNRAFGVDNPNWRWIGIALFLLLAPVIYEGIASLLTAIGSMVGMPMLNVLSNFSIFQNTLAQILWLFLTLLAIIFASIGLYGICVQFGVIGGRRNRQATVVSKNPTINTGQDLGTDTVVDWDEDF